MTLKTYYIDESGNTGDLQMSRSNMNFSEQEYFSLACVGIDQQYINDISRQIDLLKKKYKIQSTELKSSRIYRKKISFILDVIRELIDIKSDILIEVVDKKYFITVNMVFNLFWPPYYTPKIDKDIMLLLNMTASYLYKLLPNEFYISFSEISRNPSHNGLLSLFDKLKEILTNQDDTTSTAILDGVNESLDDYNIFKNKKNVERPPYTYFLPLPDKNKIGQNIAMLPHISSFTNIYARLNLINDKKLDKLTIIHDQQDYFDDIIDFYKNEVEDNNHDLELDFLNSNYLFNGKSKLLFHDSKSEIGLQLADLFAGFTTQFFKSTKKSNGVLSNLETYSVEWEIFSLLQEQNDKLLGTGINMVTCGEEQEQIFNIAKFAKHRKG